MISNIFTLQQNQPNAELNNELNMDPNIELNNELNMENLMYDKMLRNPYSYRTSSFGSIMVLLGVFQFGLFLSGVFVSKMYSKYRKYCDSIPEYTRPKHYLEKYGFTKRDFERKNEDEDDTLRNSCVVENTPNGTVHMSYDKDIETFVYWSNTNIPNKYLEVVARKFAKTFDVCHLIKRPLWDFEEEERLNQEDRINQKGGLDCDDDDDDWDDDLNNDGDDDLNNDREDDGEDDDDKWKADVDENGEEKQKETQKEDEKDKPKQKKSVFLQQKKYNQRKRFNEDDAERLNHFRRIGTIQELYETMNKRFIDDFNKNKKSHTITMSWEDYKKQQELQQAQGQQ